MCFPPISNILKLRPRIYLVTCNVSWLDDKYISQGTVRLTDTWGHLYLHYGPRVRKRGVISGHTLR